MQKSVITNYFVHHYLLSRRGGEGGIQKRGSGSECVGCRSPSKVRR